jgi:hypothetical protein
MLDFTDIATKKKGKYCLCFHIDYRLSDNILDLLGSTECINKINFTCFFFFFVFLLVLEV